MVGTKRKGGNSAYLAGLKYEQELKEKQERAKKAKAGAGSTTKAKAAAPSSKSKAQSPKRRPAKRSTATKSTSKAPPSKPKAKPKAKPVATASKTTTSKPSGRRRSSVSAKDRDNDERMEDDSHDDAVDSDNSDSHSSASAANDSPHMQPAATKRRRTGPSPSAADAYVKAAAWSESVYGSGGGSSKSKPSRTSNTPSTKSASKTAPSPAVAAKRLPKKSSAPQHYTPTYVPPPVVQAPPSRPVVSARQEQPSSSSTLRQRRPPAKTPSSKAAAVSARRPKETVVVETVVENEDGPDDDLHIGPVLEDVREQYYRQMYDNVDPNAADDETMMMSAAQPRRRTGGWKGGCLLFALVALVSVVVATWMAPRPPSTMQHPSIPTTPPCFADYPPVPHDTTNENAVVVPPHCVDVTVRTPCPDHATCRDGTLVACHDPQHYTVDAVTFRCTLTDEAVRTLDSVVLLLQKFTVQHMCVPGTSNPFFVRLGSLVENDDENNSSPKRPMYSYSKVADVLRIKSPASLTQEWNETFLLKHDSVHGSIVGLHPQYPVDLPKLCLARRTTFTAIGHTFVWVWALCVILIGWYIRLYQDAPFDTLVATALVFVVAGMAWYVRTERRRRRQFVLDVVTLRDQACRHLHASAHSPVVSTHLCERVVWDLYPTNRRLRQHLTTNVWPTVLRDLQTDRRIQVSHALLSSKESSSSRRQKRPDVRLQWIDAAAPAAAATAPVVQFASHHQS